MNIRDIKVLSVTWLQAFSPNVSSSVDCLCCFISSRKTYFKMSLRRDEGYLGTNTLSLLDYSGTLLKEFDASSPASAVGRHAAAVSSFLLWLTMQTSLESPSGSTYPDDTWPLTGAEL